MEEQTRILESFVAGVSTKHRRAVIYLFFGLVVSLSLGSYLLIRSVTEVKRRQLAELEAAIAERGYEKSKLEKEIEDLRRYRDQLTPDTPPYRLGEFDIPESNAPLKPADLVQQFSGDNRLIASNQLIRLYDQNKTGVVKALVEAIQADNQSTSYRVNLYIAFTLGRVKPVWEGTDDQLAKIRALKMSKNYRDPTFKKWVDLAVDNYSTRSL